MMDPQLIITGSCPSACCPYHKSYPMFAACIRNIPEVQNLGCSTTLFCFDLVLHWLCSALGILESQQVLHTFRFPCLFFLLTGTFCLRVLHFQSAFFFLLLMWLFECKLTASFCDANLSKMYVCCTTSDLSDAWINTE